MANFVYPSSAAFAYGGTLVLDDPALAVKAGLVRGYAASTGHQFLSDVTGAGGTVLGSNTQSGKNLISGAGATQGTYDANDDSLGVIATGAAAAHVIIWRDTGTATTSKLFVCIDTASGLPLTPNGSTVNILWDNGNNRIVKIGG